MKPFLGRGIERIAPLFILLLPLCVGSLSHAGEGGQSEYRTGFRNELPGILPGPGFYFTNYLLFQNPSAPVAVREGQVEANIEQDEATDLVSGTYVTPLNILGSHWAVAAILPFTYVKVSGQPQGASSGVSLEDHTFAQGDVLLEPLILGWSSARHHFTLTTVAYAPTGKYDVNDAANVGKNRWAIEEDFGYTWLGTKDGHELSADLGYTIPFSNTATDYTSGQELHLDFALMQHFAWGLATGVAGYWLQQTTADSGSGAKLGAFKGHTFGLGPMVSWYSPKPDHPIGITLKFYWDLDTGNRLKGEALWYDFVYHF